MARRSESRVGGDVDAGARSLPGLLVLLLLGVFVTGGPVTYYVEVFRASVFAVGVVALAGVGLVVPWLRGVVLRVHPGVVLFLGLCAWLSLREVTALPGRYYGPFQLAKLWMVGVVVLTLAARRDVRWNDALAHGLALCTLVLGALIVVATWLGRGTADASPLMLVFGNRNHLGATVAVSTTLLAGLTWAGGLVPAWRRVCVVASGVGFALTIATQSRGAALGLGVGGASLIVLGAGWIRRQGALRTAGWLALFAIVLGLAVTFGTGARFRTKLRETATSASDARRLYYYRVALDHVTSSPLRFLAGAGLSSFQRDLYSADPAAYGFLGVRRGSLFVHDEYLEWWHDGGIVALGLFLAVVTGAVACAGRAVGRSERDGRERMTAAAALAALAAWCAVALVSVGTRHIGGQAMLAVALGLAFQPRSRGAGIRLSGWQPAAALVVVASGSLVVLFLYFQSARALQLAVEPANAEAARRSEQLAWEALSWRPDNVVARYTLLTIAQLRQDLDAAREHWQAIDELVPHYRYSDVRLAEVLGVAGEYRDACQRIRDFARVGPFEFPTTVWAPVYASAARDDELLGESLLELLARAVIAANLRDGTSHEVRLGGAQLTITPQGGGAPVRLAQADARAVLFRAMPRDASDRIEEVERGIDRFLRTRLGITEGMSWDAEVRRRGGGLGGRGLESS